jgi:hypothetical protein
LNAFDKSFLPVQPTVDSKTREFSVFSCLQINRWSSFTSPPDAEKLYLMGKISNAIALCSGVVLIIAQWRVWTLRVHFEITFDCC